VVAICATNTTKLQQNLSMQKSHAPANRQYFCLGMSLFTYKRHPVNHKAWKLDTWSTRVVFWAKTKYLFFISLCEN